MKDKVSTIVLVILSIIAVAMVLLTMFVVGRNEHLHETPCEELIKESKGNSYVPIPKRCEKGE